MLHERLERNKYAFPLLVVGVWTAFGLFFGTQDYVRDVYFGRGASLPGYLISWLLCGYSWGILTFPVLKFVRRFPLGPLGLSQFFLVHIPAGAAFAAIQLGLYSLIAMSIAFLTGSEGRSLTEFYERLVVREFQTSFLVYLAIISAVSAYDRMFTEPAEVGNTRALTNGNGNGDDYPRRIPVKQNGRILLVDTDDISWVESYGNYVFLHTPERRHIYRETMSAMETKLDGRDFVRIRRSALVRIGLIEEIHPAPNGVYEIVLKDGTNLASTRRYRKNLETLVRS